MSFLKKINILIFICIFSHNINAQEEFIIEVRIEDGDAFHKEYLYEHIKSVLSKFQNDFNTKWEGEFYIDNLLNDYLKKENYLKLLMNIHLMILQYNFFAL